MTFGIRLKCVLTSTFLAGAVTFASDSNKMIIESVKVMEREQGLTIATLFEMGRMIRRTQQIPDRYTLLGPSVSPDGSSLAWSSYPNPATTEKTPFLMVMDSRSGIRPINLEGRIAVASGLSNQADMIVAVGIKLDPRADRHRELLAIERRVGGVLNDLTRSVTQFDLGNNLEVISVSGTGNLVALGEREPEHIKVIDIPSGKVVYTGPGRFPRLSPDGRQIAFVNQETICFYSFTDGSTRRITEIKRVKGLGAWSPDGRFLIAGAWVTEPAFEKSQILVDTDRGEYAVLGKLGDGEYGNQFAWITVKILEQ